MREEAERRDVAEKEMQRYKDYFGVLGQEVGLAKEVRDRQEELDALRIEMKKLKGVIFCDMILPDFVNIG